MRNHLWLLAAASVAFAGVPIVAQIAPISATSPSGATAPPERQVEGATAERVAQIERCQGHKFDTMVEIDPVKKRSTRVKLCANPGSSDADWVKTLDAAIVQIEQRDMPAAAKDKVIAELRQEMAKFGPLPKSTATSIVPGATFNLGGEARAREALIAPVERYETSVVPPLPAPLPRRTASAGGATRSAASVPRVAPMRFRIKCLVRGETGAGATCDYFESGTVLALSAVEGLEKGATLRFRRRGEARGDVTLAPLAAGQSVRVRLPSDLCRGVSYTKIELELLPPGSSGTVAGREGPFAMRC